MTIPMESDSGYIFEIQKMSTEDGPGIRTTVFFKECPLRCIWCHNPESLYKKPAIMWFKSKCIGCRTCIEVCPEKALKMDENGLHIDRELCKACGICVEECPATAIRQMGKWISLEELIADVSKDRAYYFKSGGGITASGGAAALQSEFLTKFFKRCKEEGFHTALDICGILPRSKYEPILPYVDLYLYDLKEIDSDKHKKFTGATNERILNNLIWLIEEAPKYNNAVEIWIRTPVIPQYTATEENIRGIGNFIVKELKNKITRWDLLAFNNLGRDKYERMDIDWELKNLDLLTEQEMEYFHQIAVSTGVKNVQWSGLTKSKKNVDSDAGVSSRDVEIDIPKC